MFGVDEGIKVGLKNILCPYCNNQLSVIFGGLFGEKLRKINSLEIKYISGCCFENENFYCEQCKKYFDKNLHECR